MTDLEKAAWSAVSELAEVQRIHGGAPSTGRTIRELVEVLVPVPAAVRAIRPPSVRPTWEVVS